MGRLKSGAWSPVMHGGVQLALPPFIPGGCDTMPCPSCNGLETEVNASDEWTCRACGYEWQEV